MWRSHQNFRLRKYEIYNIWYGTSTRTLKYRPSYYRDTFYRYQIRGLEPTYDPKYRFLLILTSILTRTIIPMMEHNKSTRVTVVFPSSFPPPFLLFPFTLMSYHYFLYDTTTWTSTSFSRYYLVPYTHGSSWYFLVPLSTRGFRRFFCIIMD